MPHPPLLLTTTEQYLPAQRGLGLYWTQPPFNRRVTDARRHRGFVSGFSTPVVVLVPSVQQQQQTVRVTLAGRTRVESDRRASYFRLAPPMFYPATSEIGVTAAVRARLEAQRRAPRSRLAPPATLAAATPNTKIGVHVVTESQRSSHWRRSAQWRVGGPVVVLPLPTLEMMTVSVTCAAVRARAARPSYETVSRLEAPTVVAVAAVAPPLHTALVAVARRVAQQQRNPHFDLAAPTVLAQPPPTAQLVVHAVGGRTRVEAVRRHPFSRLTPPVFYPASGQISVTLAARRTRIEAPRRAPHSKLSPPVVLKTFPGPTVTVAVRPPVERSRRGPRSFLRPPAAVRVPSVEQAEQTIRVQLAPSRRRAPRSFLRPPTVLAPVETRVRVALAAVAGRLRPVRGARSRLSPPVFYPSTSTIRAALAAVTGSRFAPARATSNVLAAPAVVIPTPSLRDETIRVTLAGRTRVEAARRAPRSRLAPPVFYPSTSTIDVDLAGRTRVEATRRAPHSRLPLVIVQPLAPRPAVAVAGRTRIEAGRRGAHYLLGEPTVVTPVPTQQQQTISVQAALRPRTEAQRRAPHSNLRPPTRVLSPPSQRDQTIRTALVAVRTPTERPRHRPAVFFTRPAVVAPAPLPRRDQLDETVWLTPRAKLEQRYPHSHLTPPVFVATPVPPTPPVPAGGGVGGSGFPPDRIEKLLEQIQERGVGSLDDDDIAILMHLGYL